MLTRIEMFMLFVTGGFIWIFSMYCIQHGLICRHSHSTILKGAGIEPRTVATSALAVRRSDHAARSHLFLYNFQVRDEAQ